MERPTSARGSESAPRRLGAAELRYGGRLVSQSILSQSQLDTAVAYAEAQRVPLADAILTLGLAPEEPCYEELARASGTQLVSLEGMTPSPLAMRLVPVKIVRQYGLLPLTVDNRVVTYATSRPYDSDAERDVAFASGRKAVAVLARPSELHAALDIYFPGESELDLLLSRVRSSATVDVVDTGDVTVKTGSPIVDLCNHIVARAVEAHASDIHVEPTAQGLTVRFRLAGILEPIFIIPAEAAMGVRNRYKIMAKADISVRHRPQDGAFRLLVDRRPIDVRFSTLPTIHGEKMVMRVIDAASTPTDLDALGYDADNLARLKVALARPDGLILVTGPTGSGKSTVLYSALAHLRSGRTNIVSIEDPVERQVQGVNQIQVSTLAGNTFTSVLRSVLRQDPNVIMVGEIRDNEVAQMVGQAAYTGHLVLSTLHTADAASAITRLMNLGLEPFKIAESLAAVVAQRLLRRLCPECRHQNDAVTARHLGAEHGLPSVPFSAGPGCAHCKETGYVDRLPVAEILTPDDEVRGAIGRGATATEIRASMRAAGRRSMRDRALELVAEGVTSIEEVDRVLAVDAASSPEAETAPHAPPARTRHRVLIVDDDQMTRMLLRMLLEKEGYDVSEAVNGRQAIDLAKVERPDLMVTDLMMPDMDGYEVITHVRHDVTLSTLPVLVVTSGDGPGIEERVLGMGADDYLVKPFDAPVLLLRVAAALRRAGRVAA